MDRKKIKAWYFAPENGRLSYGDNREIGEGITHEIEGTPILCKHGLHASKRVLDALQYATSPILWQVELSGGIVKGNDKIVGTSRTYIKMIDTTDILLKFSRLCALDVVHLWDAPDAVISFLKTGKSEFRESAYAAACAATDGVGAAYAAACAATNDAAATDVVYAAACAATDGVGAAYDAQNKRLTAMIRRKL